MSEKLLLIDGQSILSKAFYSLPNRMDSEGKSINGVYGFMHILFKTVSEEKINQVAVAFDGQGQSFRHKMFQEYKSLGEDLPIELLEQFEVVKKLLTLLNIEIIEKDNAESIDVIGSVIGNSSYEKIVLLTSDKLMLQLVDKNVKALIPVIEAGFIGLKQYDYETLANDSIVAQNIADMYALTGDKNRNVCSLCGVGEGTAKYLILEYGTIDNIYDNLDKLISKEISRKIGEKFEEIKKYKELFGIRIESDVIVSNYEMSVSNDAIKEFSNLKMNEFLGSFDKATSESDYNFITEVVKADEFFGQLAGKKVAFSYYEDVAWGLAFDNEKYIIILSDEISKEYIGDKINSAKVERWIVPNIKECLKMYSILDGLDAKEQKEEYINRRKLYHDISIAAYLINPLTGDYTYDLISAEYLKMKVKSKKDFLGKKSVKEVFEEDKNTVAEYIVTELSVTLSCEELLINAIKEKGMSDLYENIEMPVAFVLSDMEKEGISIDGEALKEYGEKLSVSIDKLEKEIYELAGEKFNINSPKQLGIILFEKLGLPNAKKTKTGYSTSAEVLEKLSKDYPIVNLVLEYRQLSKLKSTYADGLSNYIAEDNKIHTTFNQTITATGRLSSTDPNLQNIPIRIELGRLIRKVFHPMEGNCFLDSDYSQIELRVLAAMSGDPVLIDAFKAGQDIHRTTAASVFNVEFDEVTDLQRRNAKAVNFGIVYGMSAYGLGQDLNISTKEAQNFIDSYFKVYPKIKEFLDKAVSDAKLNGYTKTLCGRIRPIPELSSGNFNQKQFGERVAMNSPIQGTAADIIKIAMIKVHDRLICEGLKSRLILQVHDELLVETVNEEKDKVREILEEEMKNAVSLPVAMEVETGCGLNWYDAH